MRPLNLAAALVLACTVFLAPALAAAQHEPMHAEHVEDATSVAPDTHGVRLADESERLTPPSEPDLSTPILGIASGAVLLAGGIAGLFVGMGSAIGESVAHRGHDTSDLILGLGAGGAALGAICLVSGIVGLVDARHRARDAEQGPNLAGVTLAPVEGGAVATAWGTF